MLIATPCQGGGCAVTDRYGATVAKRRLARLLSELRVVNGYTANQVCDKLNWGRGKVGRVAGPGRRGAPPAPADPRTQGRRPAGAGRRADRGVAAVPLGEPGRAPRAGAPPGRHEPPAGHRAAHAALRERPASRHEQPD